MLKSKNFNAFFVPRHWGFWFSYLQKDYTRLAKNVIIYILSFGRQKVNSSTKFTWFIQKAWSTTFHCVKSVSIRSFSSLYFPTFGLNTERYGVFLRIQSKCGKTLTRKTPNTNTFHGEFFLFIASTYKETLRYVLEYC